MMKDFWYIDAATIDVSNFNFEKYIARTPKVSEFIESSRFIIVAPKGYGKTLLLKYVYHNVASKYEGQKIITVPANSYIDYFDHSLPYEGKLVDFLSSFDTWQCLWQLSLAISIIIHYSIRSRDSEYLSDFCDILKNEKIKFNNILVLIEKITSKLKANESIRDYYKIQANPSSILSNILSLPLGNIQSSIPSALDRSHQWCLSIDRPVYVFIDQIDQGISEYPLEIWKNAQNGIVGAIFRIHNSNRQIKIYASVRKEAWDSCIAELHTQYHDIVSELTYSEPDLENIFEHAVRTYESTETVKLPDKYAYSPIVAFTGLEKVENVWNNIQETPFKYMLRHTLRRPRDLIMFGEEIHRLSKKNSLGETNFRDSVNRIPGEEIQKQYMKEVARFTTSLQYTNVERFFSFFRRNILTKSEIQDICRKYNNHFDACISYHGGNCRDCNAVYHIFCDLYRIGLLGIVTRHETKQDITYSQHFETTGKVRSTFLPDSNYYLIHPAVDHYIKVILENLLYSPVRGAVVGHGENWTEKHKALVCLADIDGIINQHEAVIGVDILRKCFNELNKEILSDTNKDSILKSLGRFKTNMTSNGLLSASSFINNVISSVDKLVELIKQW